MIVIPAMDWPGSGAMDGACFLLCPSLRWHDEQELGSGLRRDDGKSEVVGSGQSMAGMMIRFLAVIAGQAAIQ